MCCRYISVCSPASDPQALIAAGIIVPYFPRVCQSRDLLQGDAGRTGAVGTLQRRLPFGLDNPTSGGRVGQCRQVHGGCCYSLWASHCSHVLEPGVVGRCPLGDALLSRRHPVQRHTPHAGTDFAPVKVDVARELRMPAVAPGRETSPSPFLPRRHPGSPSLSQTSSSCISPRSPRGVPQGPSVLV